ncbi:hypothetical protein [Lysobacter sp. 22409]|uniref:hypothetical protein n=1 Tax=Lysobacter sp. 22409 TaxID=3453917 RepID=UPI003F871DEC
MSNEPSCFGIARISWNPKGYGSKSLSAIAADLMVQLEDFIGARLTVYGFTPDGALGADHGALVLELELGPAKTRIGVNFAARDYGQGAIRHGFDADAWREAPTQWNSAGIWLANAEETLALLCALGRLLEVRDARFVYGNPDRLRDAEEAKQHREKAACFQSCSVGAGEPKGFDPSFVGFACVEVLRQWTYFTGAGMDVRFFTPPEATWIDHVAMVIEVTRGSRRTCIGAHFGASFDSGKAYRKMLDPTNWKGSSEDWQSSGLYLLTWAEAWAFLCALGERLNIRSVRMCYGEGEASYLVRIKDGLDAR